MEKIIDFYNKYDEENRLTVRHKTEFFVTTYFLDSIIMRRNHKIECHPPTDGSLFDGFNKYLDNFYYSNNSTSDGYAEFQESLSNMEDFHFWLDENYFSKDIHAIDEKFIHGLMILKKLA